MGVLTPRKWLLLALVPGLIAFLQPFQPAGAQQLELFEEKIKAGLVYNFLKYTTWPAAAPTAQKSSLKLCLFGTNPVNGYLDPLSGKHAQQFLIDIVRVESVKETDNCSVVFISNSEKANLPDLLDHLAGKNILTMSDIQQFARKGGMVEFSKEDQRIIFYINTGAVKSAGLGIEERLLKLAKLVPG